MNEEIKDLAEKAVDEKVDELRDEITAVLERFVGPGLISPETAAPFLNASYRQIYRWLSGTRMYRPGIEHIAPIADFIRRVEGIRAGWVEILAGWRPDMNRDIKSVFYYAWPVAVLESDRPLEDKIDLLTKKTVAGLARQLEAKRGSVK